ncbi:MAG: quinone-dependent dihydroorotate dehydrogenase [Bacteroidota bacterium]
MYQILKPFLFLLPAERAHNLTVRLLKIVLAIPVLNTLFRASFRFEHPQLKREVLGLQFPNPVGLAAGFDKNGKYFKEMAALGFGFVELGTVTPKAQMGNPTPRLFRLPKDEALINRMGFNNDGVDALVNQLKKGKTKGIVVGGNIGKNKLTPNEQAVEDYKLAFDALFPYVDYFVVNVSSPNTPNLRALQEREPLTQLLQALQKRNQQQPKPKPILLKIAPDLSFSQIDDVVEIVEAVDLNGIIATNTTIAREPLRTASSEIENMGAGGLSGLPLQARATEVIRYIKNKTAGKLVIIGVGGVNSPEDAIEKLEAGASLIQIYTGLVYEGPALVKRIKKALVAVDA